MGVLRIFSVFLVMSTLSTVLFAEDRHDQLARAQVNTSFEQKFKLITPNIQKLSDANIQALENVFEENRNFQNYSSDAQAQAIADEKKMILVHSTSTNSAEAILKSGSILSVDELVRRGIFTLKKKDSATVVETDGRIGEQDVVYLALQPASSTRMFGEVTFSFDKKAVLDNSYFTLNSFTVGSMVSAVDRVTSEQLNQMVNTYRPMVFKGYEAYLKLLSFSEANELWLNDQVWFKTSAAKAIAIQKIYDEAQFKRINSNTEEKSFNLCSLLVHVNQISPSDCRVITTLENNFHIKGRILYNLSDYASQKNSAERVIRSFAFFPTYSNTDLPQSSRGTHWFWEVKVPRQLRLNTLKSVLFHKTRESRSLGSDGKETLKVEQIDTTALENAIVLYAHEHHLRFTKYEKLDNQVIYKFIRNL